MQRKGPALELRKNEKPGTTTDTAIVTLTDLANGLAEHPRNSDGAESYVLLFETNGDEAHVRVSRCGMEYLEKVAGSGRLRALTRAFPFARANDRKRLICPDFAMVAGCRTVDEVEQWPKKYGLKSRSTTLWMMNVPPGLLADHRARCSQSSRWRQGVS